MYKNFTDQELDEKLRVAIKWFNTAKHGPTYNEARKRYQLLLLEIRRRKNEAKSNG